MEFNPGVNAGRYRNVHNNNNNNNNDNNNIPQQPAGQLPRNVIDDLRIGIAAAEKARGKDLIALVGATGAGKSTIANDLMGRRFLRVRVGRESVLEVDSAGLNAQEQANIAHIGHGGISSTDYTQVYPLPDQPGKAIADTGGFYDTRGVRTQVVVVTSIKQTLEAAQSAKLVLCCEHGNLKINRGTYLTTMLKDIFADALKSDGFPNSIVIAVTRPVWLHGEDRPTTQDIIENFRSLLADTESSKAPDYELIEILQFILRENGKYILLYDPTTPECRVQLNEQLATLDPLPRAIFRPAYSAGASLAIFNTIMAISARGLQLLRGHSTIVERIATFTSSLNQLTTRRTQYNDLIAQLNQGANANPEQIRQQKEAIKEANRVVIEQANVRLQAIAHRVEAIRSRIAIVQQEHTDIANQDEQEVEIYLNHFREEPKQVKIDRSTPGHTTYKFKCGPIKLGKKKHAAQEKIEYQPLPHSYRFSYQGTVPIQRIQKTPAFGACWSSITGGVEQNTYQETYATEPGAAADAEVRVYVKRKHLPSVAGEKNQKLSQLQTLNAELLQLQNERGDKDREISAAQNQNQNLDNHLTNLTHYQQELAEIQTGIQQAEQSRNQLNEQKASLEGDINAYDPELKFLIEYRNISDDERLNRPEIEKVERKYNTYRQAHPL